MEIPNEIKILGEKWMISSVDSIEAIPNEDGSEFLGETRCKANIIKIRNDLSPYRERQTLLHEILHAMLYVLGRYEIWDSEDDIQAMATGLLNLLRDNKELVEFLMKNMEESEVSDADSN